MYPGRRALKKFQVLFSVSDGVCFVLAINASDVKKKNMYLVIPGYHKKNVMIVDGGMSTYHMPNQDTLYGDPLREEQNLKNTYRISFEEHHYLEDGKFCTRYGKGARFKTYADCVAHEYEQKLNPFLGCSIPWLSAPGNKDNCKGQITLKGKKMLSFKLKLFKVAEKMLSLSNKYDACLRPCVQMKAFSRLVKTEHMSGLVLTFDNDLMVYTYNYAYGLFELVIDVGSSLGLWIGLSALGVFDLILMAGDIAKQIIQQWL